MKPQTRFRLTDQPEVYRLFQLHIENGATTPDVNLAATKKDMISSASKVILLCSNRKVGKTSFAQFASLDQFDILVIDQISDNMKRELEEHDVDVIVASS